MREIKLITDYGLFNETELDKYENDLLQAHNVLHNKNGLGNEYLGWLDYPNRLGQNLIEDIQNTAHEIRQQAKILVVIGIGGSYLGARAVIESLSHTFNNMLSNNKTIVLFAGNNLSEKYIEDLLDVVKDNDFAINVISKSGTTTEPAVAFRLLKDLIYIKYSKDEARKRIIVTTDSKKGALIELANEEGYKTFIIPEDIGGRYSIFTPVGLLPIAVAGLDIGMLIQGAREGSKEFSDTNYRKNPCYHYALCRKHLYENEKMIEIFVCYEPCLNYIAEWWKQLFGESEGKDGKGLFPSSLCFTTDLHSMGQYIQDGHKHIFETILDIRNTKEGINIPFIENDIDKLNYLHGKTINYVNKMAQKGTIVAHNNGGVPNLVISVDSLDEANVGKLLYFFEKACAISGYMLGVNPFNQPGVEEYKKNMFILLEKPGYREENIAN